MIEFHEALESVETEEEYEEVDQARITINAFCRHNRLYNNEGTGFSWKEDIVCTLGI